MPALSTRKAARTRILTMMQAELERIIPEDEAVNLKGKTFAEFEDQVERLGRTVCTTALEERAALDESARVEQPGCCPFCGSERVYLERRTTPTEVFAPSGVLVLSRQHCRCRACDRGFSPQAKSWGLPGDAPLTPHALRRVAREVALQPVEKAAQALNEDWPCQWDGKQLQRWAERVGLRLVSERDAAAAESESGRLPDVPANPPQLLVIEVDGGRVQMRDKEPETQSRWREDKVAVVSSYVPGDGAEQLPEALVKTHVATMEKTEAFGRLVRVEAEGRGLNQADEVLILGDGGNWIDPLIAREFKGRRRIIDWYHAAEHLHACGRAVHGPESPQATAYAERLKSRLWEGDVAGVLKSLSASAARWGPPQVADGKEHPRRVLANNVAYFREHREHMNYPEYRRRGWPIGSGGVEGAVKQFNKRVKGTEQFWHMPGVEAILTLRALWLSGDERWHRYWAQRRAYPKLAA